MYSLRSRWCVVFLAALAASCWDGALDPILGAPDGGDLDTDADSDTDADADSDTGTDSETAEPIPCVVDVVVYVDEGDPYCGFSLEGVCRTSSAACEGCAWLDPDVELCEGGGVCCVPETSFAICDPYVWPWSSLCGYFANECPEDTVSLASTDGQPECPGGEFCCYLIDSK